MGAVGLEPTETEVEGFTVPCNCRYATPPANESDAGSRTWTHNRPITSRVLYQLSYASEWKELITKGIFSAQQFYAEKIKI